MMLRTLTLTWLTLTLACLLLLAPSVARAQKVFLNPSNQTANPVAGGGNEAQYALINANLTKTILDASGFDTRVYQDFSTAPSNANSWGANIFVSIHSNAGGGHGIETLYKTANGKVVADAVQNGLLSMLPYGNRGLKVRTDLHVLNNTNMPACLTEVLFHDCASSSGITGHPPSESSFLKSTTGQQKISGGMAAGVCAYYNRTCGTATPSKGWLKGVVYRAPNIDDRIQGATVTLNTGASVVSDTTGSWAFELVPDSYTATATAAGYKPGSSTRTVVAGTDVWGSIGLEPEDSPSPEPGPEPGPEAGPDVDIGDAAMAPDGFGWFEPGATIGYADSGTGSSSDPTTRTLSQESDSGCGCTVPVHGSRGAAAALLAAVTLLVTRRRRG